MLRENHCRNKISESNKESWEGDEERKKELLERNEKRWSDPKERKRRLIDFLNLEDLGQRYDVGMIGKSDDCTFTFIAVFFDEFIDFYKIQINYKKPGENKILDEKRLTPDGYEWIARSITHSKLGIGKLIDKNDIFINLFWQ